MADDELAPFKAALRARKPMPRWRKVAWGALLAVALLSAGWSYERMVRMPGRSFEGPLPPLSAEDHALAARLAAHVRVLASEIGGRSTRAPQGLERAARYVESQLREAGYDVRRETFEARGVRCENLVAERAGTTKPGELVVIGAHYDSFLDRPAANDNASGTAALIELARVFAERRGERTVRFVAFTNEEPPHFMNASMGSLVNARRAKARGDDVVAMVSLESIGTYDDHAGSQRYPFPLELVYPSRGASRLLINPSDSAKTATADAVFAPHEGFINNLLGVYRQPARVRDAHRGSRAPAASARNVPRARHAALARRRAARVGDGCRLQRSLGFLASRIFGDDGD